MYFGPREQLSILRVGHEDIGISASEISEDFDCFCLLHPPLLFSWLHTGFFLLPQDGNGYIDENELDALLKDLCEKNKQVILLPCHLLFRQTIRIHPPHIHFWKSTLKIYTAAAVEFNS